MTGAARPRSVRRYLVAGILVWLDVYKRQARRGRERIPF